jgi:cation diffusion facilitator CzcD-associated flavoprotein CzcO
VRDIETCPETCDVAVIGAGPFGLSIAAHLRARGLSFRIFGRAMETWASRMPKGMRLKSDGFATNLYNRGRRFSYGKYCTDHGIPYADLGVPPTAESFVAYGRAFQEAFVPNLEDRTVTSIESTEPGFMLKFKEGPDCHARFVVVATGIGYFGNIPAALSGMRGKLLSHGSDHHDLSGFKGRKVAVIGAGASAADLAGLLHEAGADTHLLCRRPIAFGERMRLPRTLYERIRWPTTVIGPNWRSLAFVKLPLVFHRLPQAKRLKLTRTHLGASPGYFTKDMVLGKVTLHQGVEPTGAEAKGDGIELTLVDRDGRESRFQADHVICATGYRSALSRLPFLGDRLLSKIATVEDTPILNTWLESSVPGLFFVGALSAPSFGPVVRFACGAEFTAARVARRLARLCGKRAWV